MTCYSCGGNPETWCQQCLPADDTWIAPVDKLPDVFMGDRDHLYMTPDGNLWALSPDRTKWMKVNGQGSNYTAGDGINIDGANIINTKPNKDQTLSVNDHRLSISDGNSINLPNDKQNLSVSGRTLSISNGNSVTIPDDKQSLSINGRTVTISGGNSITLPEDRDTVYNDAEIKRRIQAVEQRTDNFVTGVAVSRSGNKVKLTYTFVNGAPKEVEFEDKDTITLAYDDSALKARVKALEDKPDKDTIYNDTDIKKRLTALENKSDKDNQTLNLNGRNLGISNGNTVALPNDVQYLVLNGNTLSLNKGGNSVTLPIPVTQAPVEVAVSDGLTVTKAGNKYTVSSKALLDRITALEKKPDKDEQTITFDNTTRDLKINRGNTVTIPDTAQPIFRIAKADIAGNGSAGSTATTTISNLMNPDGLKVGDIIQDFYNTANNSQMGYFKVTAINGQNVSLQGLGNHDTVPAPTLAQFNDLNNRFNTLKSDYDRVIQALHKIVSNLQSTGAWTGGITGQFVPNRNIATGNINLFGGTADGNAFIRTNNGKTENDLAGGIN